MGIYTGTGDRGQTSLLSGERAAKDSPMVEAYGTLDELGAQVGLCRAMAADRGNQTVAGILFDIQQGLFRAGMQLSASKPFWSELPRPMDAKDIETLEQTINRLEQHYSLPDFFVTPGETCIGAALHVARTICRRAERRIITAARGDSAYNTVKTYVNRLSDALFALSWAAEIRELLQKELNAAQASAPEQGDQPWKF